MIRIKTPFASITIKPTPPDEDLMQELHREGVEADYERTEIATKIMETLDPKYRSVGNYQSSMQELLNVAEAAGKLGVKPEPMKKYELLKYAYDNYPKGTIARFGGKAPDHTSTGKFEITDLNSEGDIQVMSENGLECFYCYGEWAEIISLPLFEIENGDYYQCIKTISNFIEGNVYRSHKQGCITGDDGVRNRSFDDRFQGCFIKTKQPASILSGKCAIQVNNEREFNLLMEHYESKGWKWYTGTSPIDKEPSLFFSYPNSIKYHDRFQHSCTNKDYTIIPFADLAKEVGIKVPVFVLRSEDGVDLYEGDSYSHAYKHTSEDIWSIGVSQPGLSKDSQALLNPKEVKAFSTREAAEKWITKKNKPKHAIVSLFTGMEAHVYAGEILIKDADRTVTTLHPSDLEDMLHTYKSLQ